MWKSTTKAPRAGTEHTKDPGFCASFVPQPSWFPGELVDSTAIPQSAGTS
jgi:hypothetical protein